VKKLPEKVKSASRPCLKKKATTPEERQQGGKARRKTLSKKKTYGIKKEAASGAQIRWASYVPELFVGAAGGGKKRGVTNRKVKVLKKKSDKGRKYIHRH